MLVLAAAVLTASFLGSTHCVGMCGPLAMWASGLGESASKWPVIRGNALYHFGRMLTYIIAGTMAGALGSLVDVGGSVLGVQLAAARVVGTVMIIIGIWRLAPYAPVMLARTTKDNGRADAPEVKPSRIGRWIAAARPLVSQLSPASRALVAGLLTTLLPCGWLYLFALIAAGTGSPLGGAVVMAAFWLGTVPALTALVAGTMVFSKQAVRLIPIAASVLLVFAGAYTATGRGLAQLDSITDVAGGESGFHNEFNTESDSDSSVLISDLSMQVQAVGDVALPCCIGPDAIVEVDDQ